MAADEAVVVAPAEAVGLIIITMEEGERLMAMIPPLRLVADEVEEVGEREEEEDGRREGTTTVVELRVATRQPPRWGKKPLVGGEEEDERGGHAGEEELQNPLPARMT